MTVLLGFDFGMKHIGVAVGQTITQTATPLTTLQAKDGIPTWSEITTLITDYRPDLLVVGIPLNMDGTEQLLTFCAKKFAQRLHAHTNIVVEMCDERLSTWEAKQRMLKSKAPKSPKAKQKMIADVNAMSAAILVEQYLTLLNFK